MKSCSCRDFSLKTAYKIPKPVELKNISARGVWACAGCHGHRFAVQEPVPVIKAPKNATALLGAKGHLDGRHIQTWATTEGKVQTVSYFPWTRRFPMTETEPLIFLQWEHLMKKVAVIIGRTEQEGKTDDEIREGIQRARYEARGIAEVLAMQMKPFMADADDVVKNAVAFHKNPDHEVPGLARYLWDPLRDTKGEYITLPKHAHQSSLNKPASKAPAIPAESMKGIKEALSSGMFTAVDIASMYKVPVEAVEALVKDS